MKFRVIASIVVIVVLVFLGALFDTSENPTAKSTPSSKKPSSEDNTLRNLKF